MSDRIPVRGETLRHEVRGSGETVLYDETGNQLLVLNDVGAAIWLLVDNQRTIGAIADIVVETIGTPATQVLADVSVFLEELEGKDLISWR